MNYSCHVFRSLNKTKNKSDSYLAAHKKYQIHI